MQNGGTLEIQEAEAKREGKKHFNGHIVEFSNFDFLRRVVDVESGRKRERMQHDSKINGLLTKIIINERKRYAGKLVLTSFAIEQSVYTDDDADDDTSETSTRCRQTGRLTPLPNIITMMCWCRFRRACNATSFYLRRTHTQCPR